MHLLFAYHFAAMCLSACAGQYFIVCPGLSAPAPDVRPVPCRPSRFYRIPLLHATLYGLAKHFCSTMGRAKTVKLLEGDEHRLSDDSLAKIARNLKRITLTSSFTGQVKNPFTCVQIRLYILHHAASVSAVYFTLACTHACCFLSNSHVPLHCHLLLHSARKFPLPGSVFGWSPVVDVKCMVDIPACSGVLVMKQPLHHQPQFVI